MSIEALGYIDSFFESIDVPYEFMEWTGNEVPETYFIGEYQEIDSLTKQEDGLQESSFTIEGFSRGSWLELMDIKEKIEKRISTTAILGNKSGFAVFYSQCLVIPTGDHELKRIQITLNIKEWKVDV